MFWLNRQGEIEEAFDIEAEKQADINSRQAMFEILKNNSKKKEELVLKAVDEQCELLEEDKELVSLFYGVDYDKTN